MTPEQATALVIAITGLLAAFGTVYNQVRGLRRDIRSHQELIDGRMADLLTLGQLAAKRQGELEGRDYATGPPQPRQTSQQRKRARVAP